MWTDPIVEEIHQIRQTHAAKFNYDIHAILMDYQERQKQSGKPVVSFANSDSGPEYSEIEVSKHSVPPIFHGQLTLTQEGQLTIDNLPCHLGESVEVIIRSQA